MSDNADEVPWFSHPIAEAVATEALVHNMETFHETKAWARHWACQECPAHGNGLAPTRR